MGEEAGVVDAGPTDGTALVVAIDGPSGVGKSTVARRLADRLGLPTLDTGAMYRALGLKVLEAGVDPTDLQAVRELAEATDVDVELVDGKLQVLLEGLAVGDRIRRHAVSEVTSQISTLPEVRRRMVDLQRRAGQRHGAVVEGRDIGTVVFPDTPHKFFLRARVEVRAERRWRELEARGQILDREELQRDLERRDARDRQRAAAPLRYDETYRVIDTSDHTIDEVVAQLDAAVRQRLGAAGGDG